MPNVIKITDFSDKALDLYARTKENQLAHINEPDKGYFIAESPKVIERAISTGLEPISFLMEDKHVNTQCMEILNNYPDIPCYVSDYETLKNLTGFQLTRGALAIMKRPDYKTVSDIIEGANRIAILENVVNPTNLGAIFRNAAALSIEAVLLTKSCFDHFYRRA